MKQKKRTKYYTNYSWEQIYTRGLVILQQKMELQIFSQLKLLTGQHI